MMLTRYPRHPASRWGGRGLFVSLWQGGLRMRTEEDPEAVVALVRAKAGEDRAAALLGIRLVELTPGYARVALRLGPEHVSFHGKVFGGIVMALADQAFGYGSNSIAYPSVACQLNLHFLAAPHVGDELTAECRVLKSGRRVGISEITVTTGDGRVIARATGTTIPLPANNG
jgi:acyl-CoA thioesterase